MLTFENVSYSYDGSKLLTNINFEIEDGEFVFLTGKSGSGKSTILKLINLMETPDEGTIIFNDLDLTSVKDKNIHKIRNLFGIIFQDFKFLEDRNIFQNLEYVLEISGYKKRKIKKRVIEILTEVGIVHRQKAKVDELSGGELQRAAIARAMINQPKLLIADEPTGNLDFETASEIMDLFYEINNKGTTVLFTTHNLSIIGDDYRVLNLQNGEILEKD